MPTYVLLYTPSYCIVFENIKKKERERERRTVDNGVFGQHGTFLGVVAACVVHAFAVLTERLVDGTAVGLRDSPAQILIQPTLPVGAAKTFQLVEPGCFIEARIYRKQHSEK